MLGGNMKVCVVGLRGIPNIMGGIETHCQQLYSRMDKQTQITILGRSPYLKSSDYKFESIRIKSIWAIKNKFLETFLHTFLAILYAGIFFRPDIIHIHAIGPAIWTPLAKLFGCKVVVTHHGADYDRDKWNGFAKFILKTGERAACHFADAVIVVGKSLTEALQSEYPKKAERIQHIPNGAFDNFSNDVSESELPDDLNIKPDEYILSVARLVPEKGLHDLIDAFNQSKINKKLVIVGSADHEDTYSKKLKSNASDNVIFAGRREGQALQALYKFANLFVLPSYHEGLPIVALEAISADTNVLLSDITPNKDILLPEANYYKVKNVSQLSQKLMHTYPDKSPLNKEDYLKKYNWQLIADQTSGLYKSLHGGIS